MENGEITETVFCSNEDFNTALLIAQTYLQHSLLMFNNLPRQSEYVSFHGGDSKRSFFEALPAEFSRKEATALGAQFKLGARSVDELLKTALGKTLSKLKPGIYYKV